MRDSLGLDPYANAAADRPMVLTATGYVPIEANAGREGASAQAAPAVQKYFLYKDYDANEPRVPKGNPGAGRWTGEEGDAARTSVADATESTTASHPDQVTTDANPGIQVAAGTGRSGYPIDLLEEEQSGGHTIQEHVGKSEEYLLSRLNDQLLSIQSRGDTAQGLTAQGSFPSLEAADKPVNSTVAQNQGKVDVVAQGLLPRAELDAYFPSPTGYEAFARNERSQPEIRETDGVRVVIVRDASFSRGYRVLTAFPISR